MTSPSQDPDSPRHEPPYPLTPPPAPDGPPDWFTSAWHAVSRVALFGVGATLVLRGGTDIQITAGSALMLASAGIAIAKGLGK